MSEILRLQPGVVINEIRAGVIEVISTPKPSEAPRVEPATRPGTEKAKALFGENFLGEEVIHVMESKFKAAGVNVKFEIPTDRFPYSDTDVEKAKQDEARGRGRLIVLRPEFMTVKKGGKDVKKPVNIINLRELFKKEKKNVLGQVTEVTYDNNPFGSGTVFYNQNWYNKDEDFATLSLKPGYAMPTKEVVNDSRSKDWNTQQALLEPGERRREANEVVWDTLLYYGATGKKILEKDYDWTSSRASDGRLVSVGYFASAGLRLSHWNPSDSNAYLGVCPSR